MDSDEGKLFIGGIAWDTTEERLTDYFSKYGDVTQTVIMRDKITGRPRGFGFVVFSDPSVLDSVLQDNHNIDGRTVEAKRALSREEQQTSRPANSNAGRSSGGGGNYRTKKIFVGGLPSTLTDEQFRQYFQNYGDVTDVVIMFDQNTNRPRGFGFISFDTEDAVDRVLQKTFHELNNKLVEVKRALPKDANPGGSGGGGGGGGGASNRSGGYQGYGSSGAGSFDGQMDGNRYPQQQNTGGSYPSYPGFGAASYGFGAPNSTGGYGAYGGFGFGGYGTANAGYGGPTGTYGNPNAPNSGYIGGTPNALKSQWSGQTPGYGASGYNTGAGYGANIPWNGHGSGAAVSPAIGQSPSAASGYGNQGHGYGTYGGNEGYGTTGGSTGAGVAPNSAGGGYMGGAYGNNGQSGYANAAWRTDS